MGERAAGLLGVWVEIKGRAICIFIAWRMPAEEGKTGGMKQLDGDKFDDETRLSGEKMTCTEAPPTFFVTGRGPKLATSRNLASLVPPLLPLLPLQKTRNAARGPVE